MDMYDYLKYMRRRTRIGAVAVIIISIVTLTLLQFFVDYLYEPTTFYEEYIGD